MAPATSNVDECDFFIVGYASDDSFLEGVGV